MGKYVTPSGGPDKSAFRTAPLVLPEAKSIYGIDDTGNKFLQPSGEPDEMAYRTAPIVHPDPKPLYNFGDQGSKHLIPSGQPDERAYRTSPLVLAEAKTGHMVGEQGNKHLTPSGGPINETNLPYRNSSFGTARPKTINEMKTGLGYWSTAPVQQKSSEAA